MIKIPDFDFHIKQFLIYFKKMGNCSSTKANNTINNSVNSKNIIPFKENPDIIAPKQLQSQQIFTNVIFKFEEYHLFQEDLNLNENFINKIKEALVQINLLDFDYLTEIKNTELEEFSYFLKVENETTKEITNNLSQKISTFLSNTEYSDKVKLELNIVYEGLRVTKDVMKSYGKSTLLAKPIEETEPNELIIYNKSRNILEIFSYTEEQNKVNDLSYFSFYSAYCNALNSLYISGGDSIISSNGANCRRIYDFFHSIDLITKQITKLPNLIEARFWHSMIYIPDRYVFIVGGVNTSCIDSIVCFSA